MIAFLKLIRWPNLLIVAATQFLMRYAVIRPLLQNLNTWYEGRVVRFTDFDLILPLPDFIVLVFATVFITAGGYVINDYFDTRTDIINKGKVIVGTRITRRAAMLWHNLFSSAGVLLGFYVSYRIGNWMYGFIFLVVTGVLWFYSTTYKRQFLIGNLVVAILTAMVPMLVAFYEVPLLNLAYAGVLQPYDMNLSLIYGWVGAFALFSFLLNLIREMVKDMEDFEGDLAYGRRTLPVRFGQVNTRRVVLYLSLFTLLLLYACWALLLKDVYTLVYITLFITFPAAYVCFLCLKTTTRKRCRRISNILKLIMLSGLLYSLFIGMLLKQLAA